MRVVVIGAGPAGLAAAHAATGLGCEVAVLAPKEKTPQNGPLLLQRPIPGINIDHPDGTIRQRVIGGSILDYRYKLYGDINIGINGDILKPHYHAWKHGPTYDRLWDLYSELIVNGKISSSDLYDLQFDPEVDLVISTASAVGLCFRPMYHHFQYVEVAVTPTAEYPGQPDNSIIFNAGQEYEWVRSSRVFGNEVTEWQQDNAPRGARIIRKPVSTDCCCFPKVLRTGRFGAWKNEVWIDSAYWDAYGMISSMATDNQMETIV